MESKPAIARTVLDRPVGLVGRLGSIAAVPRPKHPAASGSARRRHRRRDATMPIPRFCDDCVPLRWPASAGRSAGQGDPHRSRRGGRQASMAGKVQRSTLSHRVAACYRPDWRMPDTLACQFHMQQDRKDDTLLLAVSVKLRTRPNHLEPAPDFCSRVARRNEGSLPAQTHRPAATPRRPLRLGTRKEMGGLDIGQSVCVKDQAVLAVEAVEGTDECIRRAGELCRRAGSPSSKWPSPSRTCGSTCPRSACIHWSRSPGPAGNVLAIEAGRTILLDPVQFQRQARQLKVSVAAFRDPTPSRAAA